MIFRFLATYFLSLTVIGADIITPASRVPESDVTWPNSVWAAAGKTGGIPVRNQTVFASVKDAPYNAVGDGVTDDRQAFVDAIADCPVGQVIRVPAGTYEIGSQVAIKKGIILRGDDPTTCIIKGGAIAGILRIGPSGADITGGYTDTYFDGVATDITAGATQGSTSITVTSTTGMVVGAWVMVAGENPDVINTSNDEGSGHNWSPSGGYCTKITNIAGSVVTLADPLPWTYTCLTAYNSDPPVSVELGNPVCVAYDRSGNVDNFLENVGLEDLGFDGDGGTSSVGFRMTANCWMDNCIVTNCSTSFIHLAVANYTTIHGCYLYDTAGTGSGSGYGVLMQVKCTGNLIENNRFNKLVGSCLTDDGSNGNVIAYNYVGPEDEYFQANWQIAQLNHHRGHPMWTLYEGNYTTNIVGDDIHGSNSHTTLFRNVVHGLIAGKTAQLSPIIFTRNSSYLNSVGNILGTSGTHDDYQQDAYDGFTSPSFSASKAIYNLGWANFHSPNHTEATADTAYQHGSWDVVTNGIVWDAGNADHTLPSSLYLTAKPSWWPASMAWPPYDPANETLDSHERIPAGYLFENGSLPGSGASATVTGTLTIGP